MIVGQNALLNQYVPTFFIKDILDGQTLRYDSTRKAFINATGTGGSGATRLGELDDVSPSVDNPLALHNGQVLTFNSLTDLWENQYIGGSAGTIGQVLTSNGPGFTPTWQTVAVSGGTVTSVSGSGGTTGLTLNGGPITTAGVLTLGGTLNVANGGTGAVSLTGYIKGNGTSAFTAAATVPGADVSGNIAGNAANVTGVIAIANGGTGQTTATNAINALLPSQTGQTGKYLQTNGSIVSWVPGDGLGTVTSVTANGTQGVTTLVTNGTTTPNITIGLGAITPTSVAAIGAITGSNLSGTNTGDQTIVISGDATGSGIGPLTLTLNTVNLSPGIYGDDHFVPTITVNNKGLVTSITTQHVDTTVRDLVPTAETFTVAPRHQYIVTGVLEVDGYIVNNGVIAIL